MELQVSVTKLDTIPPIFEVEQGGQVHQLGELRDFRWSDQLREFMPDESLVSISWVKLGHEKVLEVHRHPVQSMMVVYAGSGELIGDLNQSLSAGNVIVVPAGCGHGFVGGPDELCALSIQFGEGLYTRPETPRVEFAATSGGPSLDDVLAENRRRLEAFTERPIFSLLRDGSLLDEEVRARYFRYLQIWVDGNQRLLMARQASCINPKFEGMFLQHFQEEVGHHLLHAQDGEHPTPASGAGPAPAKDAVMEAITDWFTHQMYVLDDAEKTAIIHLVIENASEIYHTHAMPVLGKYVKNDYFELHVGNDADHAEMGVALLKGESSATYARLIEVVGQAWDMLEAMTDRVVELTRDPKTP